ncbi:MAG TPA: hypothetical protein VJV03_07065 [Pyrinomonadaceae bacterium]|nr:hypothetical protein [Pyrinomonadaceae bacterium]
MKTLSETVKFDIVEVKVTSMLSTVIAVTFPPTVTESQFIVPVPATLADELTEPEFSSVIALVTSKVTPALTVNVLVAPALKVIEFITVSVVTVMLCPGAMITSSPAVGMKPPGQGAFGVVELQFPLPADVTVTAIDTEALTKTNSIETVA